MDRFNNESTQCDHAFGEQTTEIELTELDQLQLALVGGGIADVIGV